MSLLLFIFNHPGVLSTLLMEPRNSLKKPACSRLCKSKQSRVYLPKSPFTHEELIKGDKLRHFKSASDPEFVAAYKEPCVVFCGERLAVGRTL
jgi:hypothetical protein